MKFIKIIFIFFYVPLLLSGCSDPKYVKKESFIADIPLLDKVVYYVDPEFNSEKIKCIAVLPFIIATISLIGEFPSLVNLQ